MTIRPGRIIPHSVNQGDGVPAPCGPARAGDGRRGEAVLQDTQGKSQPPIVLRLDVSLPPGSDKGPRILRRVLRRLGARSYPQWLAWLALAYLWDRSAVNGHWVRATRPRLARDSAGRLVDTDGAVILHTRGKQRGAPVTKWTDRRAVLLDAEGRPVPAAGEAARERNPDASLHPWLTAADIVALGYPPERGLSASALSMRKARVLEDLAVFEAEGLIVFEAHLRHVSAGWGDGIRTWTMVRRTQSRGLGGSRVYKGAILGRQNGNPGSGESGAWVSS